MFSWKGALYRIPLSILIDPTGEAIRVERLPGEGVGEFGKRQLSTAMRAAEKAFVGMMEDAERASDMERFRVLGTG